MIKSFKDFISSNFINEGKDIDFEAHELVYQIDEKIYIMSIKFEGEILHQPAEPEVGISYSYNYIDASEPTEVTYAQVLDNPVKINDLEELNKLGLDIKFFDLVNDKDLRELTEAELSDLSKRVISAWPPKPIGTADPNALVSVIDNSKSIANAEDSAVNDYDNGWDEPDYEPDYD